MARAEASRRAPWRLLTTWEAEPGFNMALDEALLEGDGAEPTLRFYTWRPEAVSLGYFQRWADLEPLVAGRVAVRRATGGGAIHHAQELTFSIAAPLSHPLYRGDVRSSYARVHGAIAAALAQLGVRAEPRAGRGLRSDRAESAMCFHASTELDLVWDGRKGVGSAQRRARGRVLHHGSIKLGASPLEGEVATLERHAPDLSPDGLAELLVLTLGPRWEADFRPAEPAPAELRHAAARAAFFRSPAFLGRR